MSTGRRKSRTLWILIAGVVLAGCMTGKGGAGYRLDEHTGQLRAIAATDAGFVAVGYDGQDALVLTSSDALTWTREDLPALETIGLTEGFLEDVAAGNGIVVAYGSGGVGDGFIARRSPEGEWSLERTPFDYDHVVFGNGAFVGSSFSSVNATSNDGLTWSPTSGAGSIAFDGQQFIALDPALPSAPGAQALLDGDHFATSIDGFTWSAHQPTPHGLWQWQALTPVGDQVLGFANATDPLLPHVQLVGSAGQSLDTFDITETGLADDVTSGVASDGARVVVGSFSSLWTTSLPIGSAPWTSFDAGGRGFAISRVAFGAGKFVAVGLRSSPTTPSPAVLTSNDGVTWKD